MKAWGAVLPTMLRMVLLVAVLVVGVVFIAVTVEQSQHGMQHLMEELRLQIVVATVWLSPLIAGTGVMLAWLRMRSRFETHALELSGVGPGHFRLPVLLLGGLVGMMAFGLAEVVVPKVAPAELPAWVWLADGPLRTSDLVQVQINQEGIAGVVQRADLDPSVFASVRPYLSSWTMLSVDGSPSVATEWFSRLARCLACGGFSLLGLALARRRNALIQMLFVGGVLLVLESIAWTMSSSGQIRPWVGGTVSAWLWIAPFMIAWRQPET
ncbi:MAG: hypothetical protein CL930_13150 [Deltaproteobacteria bacterium]|nr:hypothetical protein [Deltaproteobacteria bacterium]